MIQTEITLYRNAQTGLQGSISGAAWAWPGVAFSAAAWVLFAHFGFAALEYARWVLAWNPNTFLSNTGVRLIHADSGPSNPQSIHQFLRNGRTTPCVDAVDITAQINALVIAKSTKTLAMQTAGNGAGGCLIYSSVIECIWNG